MQTLHSFLSFLTAWWLDPKNENSRKEEVRVASSSRLESRKWPSVASTLVCCHRGWIQEETLSRRNVKLCGGCVTSHSKSSTDSKRFLFILSLYPGLQRDSLVSDFFWGEKAELEIHLVNRKPRKQPRVKNWVAKKPLRMGERVGVHC